MDGKNYNVDELSALFNAIEVGTNLDKDTPDDYGTEVSSTMKSLRSFDSTCEDIKQVMNEDIASPQPEKKPKQKKQEVKQEQNEIEVKQEAEVSVKKTEIKPDEIKFSKEIKISSENPLDLDKDDLSNYRSIKQKYPQFTLFDDSIAFKSFYRYKFIVLKSILNHFPVLPISDMLKEISEINLHHQVGNLDVVDPSLIRQRLDAAYACRPRLTTLLAQAYAQHSLWKRSCELLSAKLWKDHESKGAHKRDALNLEHNHDMVQYYERLRGFIDAALIIDGLLKAAVESLSRQLTCITMREHSGMAGHEFNKELKDLHRNSDLDNLDTIVPGIEIEEPMSGGALRQENFGILSSSNDELDSL